MPKGQGPEPSQGSKEILRWTDDMDKILLDALVEEAHKGNRHDGAWTTEAYANVVDKLRSHVAPTMTKQHIKNRMKTLKDNFSETYDLFGSLSGFAWNPTNRRFEAEDEVWNELIREKPHAARWKTMQVKHYDVLRELFGSDRASGRRSATFRMRNRHLDSEKENDNIDLNDTFDDTNMSAPYTSMFDEGQEEPPIADSYSPAYGHSQQSTGTSGSRGTKRKAPMIDLVESQFERMTSGIGLVAEALNKGNAISDQLNEVAREQITIAREQVTIARQQVTIAEQQVGVNAKRNEILQHSRPRVYTAADVWNMLSELNVMDQYRLQCYEFLCSDEKKKELVFGVPPEMRLQFLFQMMNDSGRR